MFAVIKKLLTSFECFVKRMQRARLRRVMRGYGALKMSSHLNRIARLKEVLTEHSLGITETQFSSFVMGVTTASNELVVRQYLLLMLGDIKLNHALLLAAGKKKARVIFPLPKVWREILVQHGFAVAHVRSGLLWQFYVFVLFIYGVAKIGKIACGGITSMGGLALKQSKYVYFESIGQGNLPQGTDSIKSYDIVSWYLKWSGRSKNIDAVRHSVANVSPVTVDNIAVVPQRSALPALRGWGPIIKYLAWGLGASIVAVCDYLRGRWWSALMLNQAALAAQVRNLSEKSLAREYLFNNSSWVYRPLWTYEAERIGSVITFYFYSTNCEGFKQLDGYAPIYYGYKAMNWPRYLVWDEYQADFVRRAVGEQANVVVVGSIWFQDAAVKMPILNGPGVAVFDVTPFRFSRYCLFGLSSEFYTPAVANQFLLDVSDVCQRHSVSMLWKMKRNVGRIAHPYYRHLSSQLEEIAHIALVDPDISVVRVIESSFAVISMPFTSTALIAKEMGKLTAYYDPLGLLQKDDWAAHGIEILCGSNELNVWLSNAVTTQLYQT